MSFDPKTIKPYADLCGAYLYRAELYGADLYRANLYGADMHDADLRGADLRRADLHDADLRGANLYRADLRGADLYRADLRRANGIIPLPVAEPRRYRWVAVQHGNSWMIAAGCRWFTVDEARAHWLADDYEGPESVRQTVGTALDWLASQTLGEDKP